MQKAFGCASVVVPAVCVLMVCCVIQATPAWRSPANVGHRQADVATAVELLREASALARQGKHPVIIIHEWTLYSIGAVQLQANDLEGAQETLREMLQKHKYQKCSKCLLELDDNLVGREQRERIIRFARAAHFRLGWEDDYRDQPAYLRWNHYRILIGSKKSNLAIKAHLINGDDEEAFRAALSLQTGIENQEDELFHLISRIAIMRHKFRLAEAACDKIQNESRKASATLKIATAFARLRNRKVAGAIAGRIHVVRGHSGQLFDWRDPQCWGWLYDPHFTMNSLHTATENASELAADAMAFAISMKFRPDEPYENLFNLFDEQVIRSLARAHAAFGDPGEAIGWARKLNDVDIANRRNDYATQLTVNGLLGAAEGILDRSSQRSGARSDRN